MKSYMCVICGFVYNEADGLPEEGIAPERGGKTSPRIGYVPIVGRKEDFEMVEI